MESFLSTYLISLIDKDLFRCSVSSSVNFEVCVLKKCVHFTKDIAFIDISVFIIFQ